MKGEAIMGLAGSGLTESCLQRYHTLLQNHPPERIQVLVRSQRQGEQFFQRLQALDPNLIGPVRIETFLGFANRCLYEFWPQVRRHHPQILESFGPTVLQKDLTQQVLMETCSLCPRHAPIYGHKGLKPYQVWDQISSAAYIAGSAAIPPQQISPRLVQAWPDASDHRKVEQLGNVSCCVDRLYTACLDLASFDFGTLLLLFDEVILGLPEFWQGLDHLIVDQADESYGVALGFYDKALAELQSVYLAYTIGGGLAFTGVPDAVATWIADHCTCQYLKQTHKSSPALTQLGIQLAERIDPQFRLPFTLPPGSDPYPLEILEGETQLEAAEQMLGTVEKLRQEGVATSEIAILTPALDTGLALLVQKRMGEAVSVVRPFPALIKYPLARTFLTAAQIAHPHWGLFPSLSEGRLMLEIFLGMDPIRAQLLVEDAMDFNAQALRAAESVAYPERIGFANLERYQSLVSWIQQYQSHSPLPLDQFWSVLYAQQLLPLLTSSEDQSLVQTLIDTARRFLLTFPQRSGREVIDMIQTGQTPSRGQFEPDYSRTAVLAKPIDLINLSLSRNYLFLFDITSPLWSRTLWRPLYNPEVLSPQWDHQVFGELHDQQVKRRLLARVLLNLCCRTCQKIWIVRSAFNFRGEDNTGLLDQEIMSVVT